MQILPYIIQQTQLPSKSIENTIMLLNEDATIPFISRYRKEMTGNLDEVQIGEIVKFKALFDALEKRKKAILKVLEESASFNLRIRTKSPSNKRFNFFGRSISTI